MALFAGAAARSSAAAARFLADRPLVVDVRGDRIGIAEAGGAGGVRVGCDHARPGVDRGPVVGDGGAEGGVTSIGPDDGGLAWPVPHADGIPQELLLGVLL